MLFIVFGILFSTLTIRLVYLQLYDKARYTTLAQAQRIKPQTIDPHRGNIYDRNFNLLAMSTGAYSIHVIPSDQRDPLQAAQLLSLYLPMNSTEIFNKLDKQIEDQKNFWLIRKLKPDTAKIIKELDIPGIRLIARPQRFYPNGSLAAHVLGIAGVDNQGLEGLEYYYDETLRGVPGVVEQERDAVQRVIPRGVETITPPQNGNDLVLTIDSAIQYIAERELQLAINSSQSQQGAILVVRPSTGEILANAVYPIFDPNDYQSFPDGNRRNIIVTDQYEPGSTFKVFTAAAALDFGIVDGSREFYSGPSWSVGGGNVRSSNIYGHGNISFQEAIEVSDNITFAQLSVDMGATNFFPYLRNFGFGSRLNIDFPGEASGILPKPGEIRHGETLQWANIGFGQGIAVTPLQLLMATAAIANNGELMQPYYVAQIRDSHGKIIEKTIPTVSSQPVRSNTANILSEFLTSAVTNGSGSRARIVGVEVAGKTGTAEIPEQGGYSDQRIASFVGYAPASDPEIAVLVVLYAPQTDVRYGGVLAAPVFQTVVEQSLDYLGVEKLQLVTERSSMSVVPNVRNYSLSEARQALTNNNLRWNHNDSGLIVRDQIPRPGSRVPAQTIVNLFFYNELEPETVEVPDVIGLSMRDVNAILTELDLRFQPHGSGMAIAQNPEVGAIIPKGSVIVVDFLP